MTPDERQLLSGLFDRIRNAASQQRDSEAEGFINDAVRSQPYAPYLLAQTVIVQEQALRAANDRLQQLEAQARQQQPGPQSGGDTSFLGSIGRSIFGSGNDQPQRQAPSYGGQQQPGQGGFGQPSGGYPQQGYAPQPQGGPWGQAAAQPQAAGGGFLKGALGAAAGVAGGVLLANSISGLFRGGNNPYGITSGVPGFGGMPGGETVVNNYYENDGPRGDDNGPGGDYGTDNGGGFDNAADFGPDDGGFGSDDSYNA